MLSPVLFRERRRRGGPQNNPENHRPPGRPSHSPLAARGTPRRPSACAAGASAAIEASVDEGPRPTARREARRRASCRGEGLSSQRTRRAMWEFCRHCGAPFPPEETAVRGVCPRLRGRRATSRAGTAGARPRARASCGGGRRPEAPVPDVRVGADEGLRRGAAGRLPRESGFIRDGRGAGALPRLRRGLRGVRRLRGVVPRRRHGEARRRPGVLALLRAKARRRHLLLTDYKPRPPIPPGRGRGGKLPRPGDRAGDGRRRQGRRPWRASRRSGARTGSTSRATARWTAVCGAGDASHKPARPHVRGRGARCGRDVCAAAVAEGMRSHDTRTCGLHVPREQGLLREGRDGSRPRGSTSCSPSPTASSSRSPSSAAAGGTGSTSGRGARACPRPATGGWRAPGAPPASRGTPGTTR